MKAVATVNERQEQEFDWAESDLCSSRRMAGSQCTNPVVSCLCIGTGYERL